MRANETYSEAKRQFSVRNRDIFMNVYFPHEWWSTLKSAVFGLSSSLPKLVGGGGRLVCMTVGKTDLLSDRFDGTQSRVSVDLPLTCHPSPRLTTFAFRSRSGVSCSTWTLMWTPTNWVSFFFFLRELLMCWHFVLV